MNDTYKSMLIDLFYKTDSYKEDHIHPFLLSSGEESPYYVDCRRLLSYPYARKLVGEMGAWLLRDLSVDCVGGLESGAISVAQSISDQTNTRLFYVRKNQRTHGAKGIIGAIEGAVRAQDRAVIVDDVFTTGESVIKAATAVREAGLLVSNALVIVNRSEDFIAAQTLLQKHGIRTHSILKMRDISEFKSLK